MSNDQDLHPKNDHAERKPEIPDDFLFVFGSFFAVLGIAAVAVDLISHEPLMLLVAQVFWLVSIPMLVVCLMALVRSFFRHDRQWRLVRFLLLLMWSLLAIDVLVCHLNG